MKGLGSKLQPNNYTMSYYLQETYFLGIMEQFFLETLHYCATYSFLRNMFVLWIFTIICINFLGGLVKHTENNSK